MAFLKAALCLLFAYGAAAQDCSKPIVINGPSGSVATANPYRDNAKCRWEITVTNGKLIELSFPGRFDIEQNTGCTYDALNVYDTQSVDQVKANAVCASASTTLPGRRGPFCGFTPPATFPFISSGSRVIVEFCTDSSSNGQGFEITFKETGPQDPPPTGSTCPNADAPAVEVDGKHTVTHYNANELPNKQNCIYKFKSKNNEPLKVTAKLFDLEGIIGCRYDSLKVYEGESADPEKILGTFCGVNGPKNIRTSAAGRDLFLTLTTDEYTNGKGISLIIEETCHGDHLCSVKDVDGKDQCYSQEQTCDKTAQCFNEEDESYCTEDCGAFDGWASGKPFPGAAAITHIDGKIHCGGALINNQYVLTAAHCFHRLDKMTDRFVVKFGAARLADAFVAQIDTVTIHPQWNPKTLAHNLAIVKLKTPVPLQKSIAPFCFPTSADVANPADGTVCYSLGWGRTAYLNINSYATSVKELAATVVSNAVCKTTISNTGSPVNIDNSLICARTTGGNLCFGDNGAPLVCKGSNGKWSVAGINSISYSCTGGTAPAAFTKVSSYSDWIIKNTFSK